MKHTRDITVLYRYHISIDITVVCHFEVIFYVCFTIDQESAIYFTHRLIFNAETGVTK